MKYFRHEHSHSEPDASICFKSYKSPVKARFEIAIGQSGEQTAQCPQASSTASNARFTFSDCIIKPHSPHTGNVEQVPPRPCRVFFRHAVKMPSTQLSYTFEPFSVPDEKILCHGHALTNSLFPKLFRIHHNKREKKSKPSYIFPCTTVHFPNGAVDGT